MHLFRFELPLKLLISFFQTDADTITSVCKKVEEYILEEDTFFVLVRTFDLAAAVFAALYNKNIDLVTQLTFGLRAFRDETDNKLPLVCRIHFHLELQTKNYTSTHITLLLCIADQILLPSTMHPNM